MPGRGCSCSDPRRVDGPPITRSAATAAFRRYTDEAGWRRVLSLHILGWLQGAVRCIDSCVPRATSTLVTTLAEALVELIAVAQGRLGLSVASACLTGLGLRFTVRDFADAARVVARDYDVHNSYLQLEATWDLVENVCRRLQGTSRYGELHQVLSEVVPRRSYHSELALLLRDLRWAMLCGDVDIFQELLSLLREDHEHVNLGYWVLDPLDTSRLLDTPGPIAGTLFAHLTDIEWRGVRDLGPIDELLDTVLERGPACAELRRAAARRCLLRGEVARAQSLLGDLEDEEALYLRGWAHLAAGDPAASVKRYAKALATHRRRSGRNAAVPLGPEGVFVGLAFMLQGSAARSKQAAGLVAVARKVHIERFWAGSAYRALGDLHTALHQGEATPPPPGEHHPATTLLDTLRTVWADEPLPEGVAQAMEAASGVGWSWIVDELEAAKGERSDRPGLTPLVSHREQTSKWERRLATLESLAHGAAEPDPASTAATHRIAWVLTHRPGVWVHLKARHQKHGRAGWSVGRKVALSRLCDKPETVAGLTVDDYGILAAVRRRTHRTWRGYRKEELTFSHDETWAALVGHPTVFNDDGEPITIVERRPRIVLERAGKQLVLALDPPMEDRVVVAEEPPNHFAVTAYDKRQAELADHLGEGLEIPASQAPRLGRLLERLTRTFEVQDEAAATDAEERPADPRPVLQLTQAGSGLQVKAIVRPLGQQGPDFAPGGGPTSVLAQRAGRLCRTRRDLSAEQAHLDRLAAVLPILGSGAPEGFVYRIEDTEEALEFLLAAREAPDVVLEWPDGERFRVHPEVGSAQLRVSVTGADAWLKLRGTVSLDDALVLELVDVLGRLEGARGRFIELEDGTFMALTRSLQRRLDAVQRARRAVKGVPQIHRLASPLVDALTDGAGSVRRDKTAKALLTAFAAPEPSEGPPTTLQAELRPYQIDGFRWLRRMLSLGAGVCLADDMGLGKTLQTLAWLLTRIDDGPALVIAPTSVCGSWMEQTWRFAPTLEVLRFGPGDRAQMVANAGPGQILVSSYGLLQSEAELLGSRTWSTLVLDEAQAIKNPATRRHRVAVALRASHRIALTGTPIENHLGELWALFSFLNPGLLGTEKQFLRRFAGPIEAGQREVAAQLRQLVLPFLLRRTKSAVLQDLPAKTEIAIEVEPSAEEAAFYEALRQRAIDDLQRQERQTTMHILEKLTQLRQAACSPSLVAGPEAPHGAKLDAFRGVVGSLRANGHRALVFSQFVRHLAILRTWLDEAGIRYQYLDGSTPAKQRDARVQAFQRGEGDLFLISLRAGGTGLTLTAADYVLHMDPWWNPAVEDQASDRAHRIGQTRPVTVYRFITKGTVEEQIAALHATKRDLSDLLLSGTDAAARLTPDQLMAVLHHAHGAGA